MRVLNRQAPWEEYYANRYCLSAHGYGLTGEYPYLYHHGGFPDAGYDGTIESDMTICVESYIGEENGVEGVKLVLHSGITGMMPAPLRGSRASPALCDKVLVLHGID